ncbi:MAG: uncharacterized protein HW418_3330 [Anaerolineales bacterium]|nr:uncharacterized protein [Anaerolineales bacterium]
MKVTIDRRLCNHVLSECEQCFARFVKNPMGEDRYCITEYVEDSDPILHLTLRYDDYEEVLVLTPEQREQVANEGWSKFVKVPPKFYRE